jgi:sec-independent protein translocase protein TatC
MRRPNVTAELELVEHLAELRMRIVRVIVYAGLGMTVGWCFYGTFFSLLSAPVSGYLSQNGGSFLVTGVMEGFMIKMQLSLVVGLILAFPLISGEGWRFISPALTAKERRGVLLVSPLSVILFVLGVLLAYFILPKAIIWLAAQNPPGAKFMPSVQQTILFIVKMCLAFGIVFQLPVVLMFLARIGLINSGMLTAYWRYSVVGISIIAAVVTPSNDAFSMIMMCIPMVILYFASIWLVRIVERRR